jgi:hypothetical protein
MPTFDQLMQLLSNDGAKRPKPAGFDPNYLADESVDPAVRVDAGNNAMQGELRDRAFQAKRTVGMPGGSSPNELGALTDLLGSYKDDQVQSPIALQGRQLVQQQADTRSALDEGFQGGGDGMSAVQARNIFKRNMDVEKMRQPIQERTMMEAGLNARQGAQIDATQRQVETQMGPANRQADYMGRYYDNLIENGNPGNIKAINRNGITFQTERPNQPITPQQAQAQRDLANARNNMGGRDPFANLGATDAATQYFWQNARNAMNAFGLSGESQAALNEYLTDPNAPPFEEAFKDFAGDPEYDIARRLVLSIKGQL